MENPQPLDWDTHKGHSSNTGNSQKKIQKRHSDAKLPFSSSSSPAAPVGSIARRPPSRFVRDELLREYMQQLSDLVNDKIPQWQTDMLEFEKKMEVQVAMSLVMKTGALCILVHVCAATCACMRVRMYNWL